MEPPGEGGDFVGGLQRLRGATGSAHGALSAAAGAILGAGQRGDGRMVMPG